MHNFIHFLNGKFVTEDKLLISPRDLGFARGYAVVDFLVTSNQRPFKLREHLDRLFKSAQIIGLRIPWTKNQIGGWIKETLSKNKQKTETTIKIYITGGKSHLLYQAESPTIIIIIGPYVTPPKGFYENGVKAKAVNYKRPFAESKTTHYTEGIRQLSEAEDEDIEEIIYYDDSQVFEGLGSNLFAVIDQKLVTTKSNILPGVTRNVLLEILNLDLPIEVRDFTFDELLKATEVFLTGSSKRIRGVIQINGRPIADGKVGKITKEVMRQYNKYFLQE